MSADAEILQAKIYVDFLSMFIRSKQKLEYSKNDIINQDTAARFIIFYYGEQSLELKDYEDQIIQLNECFDAWFDIKNSYVTATNLNREKGFNHFPIGLWEEFGLKGSTFITINKYMAILKYLKLLHPFLISHSYKYSQLMNLDKIVQSYGKTVLREIDQWDIVWFYFSNATIQSVIPGARVSQHSIKIPISMLLQY